MIDLGLSLFCLLTVACASQSLPANSGDQAIRRIYTLSKQQTLDLVHAAMQEALPDAKIYKTAGPRGGFYAIEELAPDNTNFARFMAKSYLYFVDVQPAHGTDETGTAVSGYYLSVSGKGDLEAGPAHSARLKDHLEEVFEKTGRAVAVMDATAGDLKTPAEQVQKAILVQDEKASPDDVFEKIKKLKELRDQDAITDEEFQNKKKELLDRI